MSDNNNAVCKVGMQLPVLSFFSNLIHWFIYDGNTSSPPASRVERARQEINFVMLWVALHGPVPKNSSSVLVTGRPLSLRSLVTEFGGGDVFAGQTLTRVGLWCVTTGRGRRDTREA